MSRNNVRGPTSALTEFLRSSGITHTTIARRVATRTPAQDNQPTAGPSSGPNTAEPSVSNGRSAAARRRSTRASASGYASDNLDDSEGEQADQMDVDEDASENPPPNKKRKLTKAQEAKLKAKEKKKQGKKGSDDDYEDEDDTYTALSKSMWTNGSSKPPVGSFVPCATCSKEFTVTKYTMAAKSGAGFLCHKCAKAGGNDPFKKPAAPKKRKAPADKRKIVNFEDKKFPTLVSICIQLVTNHIDDVEALGDLGTMNVEAISKALSKNRCLTPENAQLFYSPANSTLSFFDATNLASPALETLVYHNANLTSLRLDFCGHLDDTAFKLFSTSLPLLERIELLGPFLIKSPAWQTFLKSHPKLQGLLITQSPRFDEDCIKALAKSCPRITELRLKEVGKLNDVFLKSIQSLKKGLWYLDLSDPTGSCTDSSVISLLRAVGKGLTYLNLSKHDALTDNVLKKGILPHAPRLDSLTLSYLPELTDEGVASFFAEWKGKPLTSIDLSRNDQLQCAALESLLTHSGSKLASLDINGWKDVGEDALKMIGRHAVELRKVDVGWCRAMDDFILKVWFEGEVVRRVQMPGCKRLEEVKVWGCNKVSHHCPRKRGVAIIGVETHLSR